MNLEEKLYTSTEVAKILGVSLRSVYRYLEQGKLEAEIKTATGRLRFTRQNILDFLYPDGEEGSVDEEVEEAISKKEPVKAKKSKPKSVEEEEEEDVEESVEEELEVEEEEEEEEIDWLSKFKAAAEEHAPATKAKSSAQKTTTTGKKEGLSSLSAEEETEVEEEEEETSYKYYKSMLGGLKEVAQNIDKVSRKSGVNYAFTLYAGLSLEKPLKKPFSVLHSYVDADSEELFKKMLQLEETTEGNAQLCLITTQDSGVFANRTEKHGLFVVSDEQLVEDFKNMGLEDELSNLL